MTFEGLMEEKFSTVFDNRDSSTFKMAELVWIEAYKEGWKEGRFPSVKVSSTELSDKEAVAIGEKWIRDNNPLAESIFFEEFSNEYTTCYDMQFSFVLADKLYFREVRVDKRTGAISTSLDLV